MGLYSDGRLDLLSHDAGLKGCTGLRTTWANDELWYEMNGILGHSSAL